MAPIAGVSSSLCKSIISLTLYMSGVMDAWKIEAFEVLQTDLALVCKTQNGWMTGLLKEEVFFFFFPTIISVGTKWSLSIYLWIGLLWISLCSFLL